MREIKFRLWLPSIKKLTYALSINDWANGYEQITISEIAIWQQFTGLKDKNGKDIYEGDVIEFVLGDGLDNERGVVRFSADGFWTSTDSDMFEEVLSEELKDLDGVIIGNIYQNPELVNETYNPQAPIT